MNLKLMGWVSGLGQDLLGQGPEKSENDSIHMHPNTSLQAI